MPLELVNGREIFESEPQLCPFLVEGISCVGATLIAGEPKIGKSMLSMQLAYAVASGEPAFGKFAVDGGGPVLCCSMEETRDILRDRQKRICSDAEVWERLECVTGLNDVAPGPSFVAALEKALSERPFAMAVVDPLVSVRDLPRQSDLFNSDYRAVAAFNELANKLNIPILIVHHTNKKKDGGDGQSRISGTAGLTAATTTNMVLTAGDSGNAKLTISSRRMPSAVHYFRMDENGLWVPVEGAVSIRSKQRVEPSCRDLVLATMPDSDRITIPELQSRLPSVNDSTLRRTLAELKGEGRLENPLRGVYRRTFEDSLGIAKTRGAERASKLQSNIVEAA